MAVESDASAATAAAPGAAAGGTAARDEAALVAQLRRTSELVAAQRLPEAELELLRAQASAPHDLRVLKLLALVRFKLGRLAEARQMYREAIVIAPEDAAIRLNLGLIALKLEWFEEAVAELETTVRLRPDDRRAWSYLGYACARTGARAQAAAAFRRAGQHELAAEMERVAAGPAGEGESEGVTGGVFAQAEGADSSGGGPVTPRPELRPAVAECAPALAGSAPGGQIASLSSFTTACMLAPARSSALLGWLSDGVLRFAADHTTHVRESALLAALGGMQLASARRRARGHLMAEPMATRGDRFLRMNGTGDLWLTSAGPDRALHALSLDRDVLYVREERVVAWGDEVVWESGRIPGNGPALLQFRGNGRVVISAGADEIVAVRVSEGETISVPAARLLGWVGRVVAQGAPGADPAPGAPYVACEGEGVLLLSRHGEPAQPADQRAQSGDDGAGAVRSRGSVLHR